MGQICTYHIGETHMQTCGMECTIIKYANWNDITIKFTDGTIVEHKCYKDFKHGTLRNPNMPKKQTPIQSHIGESHMQNCGMNCTIIEYISYEDITVKFTDETVVKHRWYRDFACGSIQNPNIPGKNDPKTFRIGETRMQNCGMECTITEYVNGSNITVKFTDGTIIKNRQYTGFTRGGIQNPNLPRNLNIQLSCHIGETRMQNCGMECTIIKGMGTKNLTVQFTDGAIVEHKTYTNFKTGQINNSNLNRFAPVTRRIGETRMQNCGMECTLIDGDTKGNITIKFADGTICERRTYTNFKNGHIHNPTLKPFHYNQKCPVHQTKTAKYYNATCKICRYNYILTLAQMSEHVKKFHPETLENYKGDE